MKFNIEIMSFVLILLCTNCVNAELRDLTELEKHEINNLEQKILSSDPKSFQIDFDLLGGVNSLPALIQLLERTNIESKNASWIMQIFIKGLRAYDIQEIDKTKLKEIVYPLVNKVMTDYPNLAGEVSLILQYLPDEIMARNVLEKSLEISGNKPVKDLMAGVLSSFSVDNIPEMVLYLSKIEKMYYDTVLEAIGKIGSRSDLRLAPIIHQTINLNRLNNWDILIECADKFDEINKIKLDLIEGNLKEREVALNNLKLLTGDTFKIDYEMKLTQQVEGLELLYYLNQIFVECVEEKVSLGRGQEGVSLK